ncbi:polysaccharide biosynthesis tyrosine autokinase [Algoriphagus aestuariicola]|jgi:capsular exopolysaccharide synthesis family protein|uniref:non-specific protein-tyrosine kinase n=1 Tax=Algoriphagus aestuariicola TaxID=1852016 RepID=A0ABS3BQF7_9BACT|nr:tyrosine-protein kinase [Algoriphagus aestuariicola]MBN7799904.1 polysaccharide biosynthesis tyrosine autokinase [Algoriphagus aestuariicola]
MNFENNENDFLVEDSSFELKTVYRKIVQKWMFIAASILICLVLGWFYTKISSPLYRVNSLFFIKEKESPLAIFGSPSLIENSGMGLQNEVIILKSRPVALRVLQKLDFQVEYFREGSFSNTEIYVNTPIVVEVDWKNAQTIDGHIKISWTNDSDFDLAFTDEAYNKLLPDGSKVSFGFQPGPIMGKFGEWLENNELKIRVLKVSADSEGSILVKLRDLNSLSRSYAGSLSVEPYERGASIMQLSLVCSNLNKGEIYLNTLMQTVMEMELEQKNISASKTVDFIDSQVAGVADSLRFFENQLQDFRSANKIYNLSSESSSVYERLVEYENQLTQERFKRNYYQNLKKYLTSENYSEVIVPSGIGIEDPFLNGLIKNLLELQSEKSRMLATQTEASPAVVEVNRKISDLNRSIIENLENVDFNSQTLMTDIQDRISEIERSFKSLPETEQNLIRIQREFSLSENIYNFLMERRAEAAISKASNEANNKVVENAKEGIQISPTPVKNYLIALMVGFFVPVLLIVISELFRTKIEDAQYLENKLKIPLLGTVLNNKADTELVVFDKRKSGISESFRSLRANMKFVLPKGKQLTFLVTSTISGEGKTFCAMNLASAYSLTGKKTVLVGCDMRKPKIFASFDLTNETGLSSYLSNQVDTWQEIVTSTKFSNLDIIVSGPIPPNPAELLFTERFEFLIKQLKQEYDVIILDTPPVGLVSETLDIMGMVDCSLFVFRQNFSQRAFVDAVNGLKTNRGLKNIFAVFNGVDSTNVTYGYGYSYGYGYGYYDEEKKK